MPENVNYSFIQSIALANDEDLDPDMSGQMLDPLRMIAGRFHSKLYLVRVAKSNFQDAFEVLDQPFRLSQIMSQFDPRFELVVGKELPHALNEFISGFGIRLIAMMPRKRSWLASWFYRSATRSMIFDLQVPLLVLPEKMIAPESESSTSEAHFG